MIAQEKQRKNKKKAMFNGIRNYYEKAVIPGEMKGALKAVS